MQNRKDFEIITDVYGVKIAKRNQGILVLVGSMVLVLILGSIHAFSVFLVPLETSFGVSRTISSFTYSITLLTLTTFVLLGHRIFKRLTPSILALVVCLIGSLGCCLSGIGNSLTLVWIGYGILFGAANGLGYALALQFSAQANPKFRGGAIGLVTAAYGLGAAISPLPLEVLTTKYGFKGGMFGLSAILIIITPIIVICYVSSRKILEVEPFVENYRHKISHRMITRLWLAFGTTVFSGLMVIGHATGIAYSAGLKKDLIFLAPIMIALANVVGSLFGGHLTLIFSAKRLLLSVSTLSIISLICISLLTIPIPTLIGLSLVGFSYGVTISAFPTAISTIFGTIAGIRAYGRVFTAWGTAGVIAPWAAGILYETTEDYVLTLLLAVLFGILSLITINRMPSGE